MSEIVEILPAINRTMSGEGFSLSIQCEGFRIDLATRELCRRLAEISRRHLADDIARGQDSGCVPLARLSSATIKRREQRARQAGIYPTASLVQRLRGASISSTTAPMMETGTFVRSLQVRHGMTITVEGDGGSSIDDGRGARRYAIDEKYPNLIGVPKSAEREIDAVLTSHLEKMMQGV